MRADVAEEALRLRGYVRDTREGLERLRAGCQGEFEKLQAVADTIERRRKGAEDMIEKGTRPLA